MSKFLRDEFLENLNISEKACEEINSLLFEITKAANEKITLSIKDKDELIRKALFPTYVIRFDQKGYKLSDFNSLNKYFQDAEKVDRLLFQVDSVDSITGIKGKKIEISFYSEDQNRCVISVQDDDQDWVEVTFNKLKSKLLKFKNRNWLVRNNFTLFLVDVFILILGFLASLILAVKIAPMLKIDYGLIFVFLIILLIFSKIWMFVFGKVAGVISYFWPSISFKPPEKINWIIKDVLGALLVSASIWGLLKMASYLKNVIIPFIK